MPGPMFLQTSRHDTIFYFRRRTPKDVQQFVGRSQIIVSLRTSDRRIAIVRARALAVTTDTLFERLRRMKRKPSSTSDEYITIDYTMELDLDDLGGLRHLKIETADNPEDHAAAAEALKATLGALGGPASDATTLNPPKQGLRIDDAGNQWLADIEVSTWTLNAYKTVLKAVIAFYGADKHLESIDQREYVRFTDEVRRRLDWSVKTRSGYITSAATFLNWHRRRLGLTPVDARSLKPKDSRPDDQKRGAFTLDELEILLRNAWQYRTLCPEKFWVTVLGAITGMRLEEMVQLDLPSDLKTDANGHWYLDINDRPDADGLSRKSVKTKAGHRVVPIHPTLERLGLVDYLQSRGNKRPFVGLWAPHIDKGRDGKTTPKWSHKVSKWGGFEFAKLRLVHAFAGGTSYFHSLRHTYITTLETVQISPERRSALAGHEVEGINATVYTKLRSNPVALRATMLEGAKPFVALIEAIERSAATVALNPD